MHAQLSNLCCQCNTEELSIKETDREKGLKVEVGVQNKLAMANAGERVR